MCLFIQDNGVYGCIVVIAEDEKSAREMMSNEPNYEPNLELNSYSLDSGHKFTNLGDM